MLTTCECGCPANGYIIVGGEQIMVCFECACKFAHKEKCYWTEDSLVAAASDIMQECGGHMNKLTNKSSDHLVVTELLLDCFSEAQHFETLRGEHNATHE